MGKYDDIQINRIPEARRELLAIASALHSLEMPATAQAIRDIVYGLMIRRSSGKVVARTQQNKIDRERVENVLRDLEMFPALHFRKIGAWHGIDGGRVAEIKMGLRTPDDPSMARLRNKVKP